MPTSEVSTTTAPAKPLASAATAPAARRLSLVLEGLALLTLGLVRPWGERVPAWFPRIGGRRIPRMAVVVPAALGAIALALIWGYAFRDFPSPPDMQFSHDGWQVLLVACYAPLVLWAPLLAAVTYAYWRRRA